ncbi:hypothetical protein [Archangium violaceum]|uniref:hypothetical protein n=1 Tax=Archangium violaceum TaxID=83451 RepID=UPI0036DBD3CF
MVSSLGHGAVASCAASRAGILRISMLEECSVWDSESGRSEPARGHTVPWVAGGFVDLGKRVALAAKALGELNPLKSLADSARSAFYLATSNDFHRQLLEQQGLLPAEYADRRAGYTQQLLPTLFKAVGLKSPPRLQDVRFGEAGFIQILQEATRQLESGTVDRCIIGGVDSFVEPQVTWALNSLRLLKTPSNPVGVLPGEAAAFAVLEPLSAAARRGAHIEALLEAPTLQAEPFHRRSGKPPLGRALTQCILATLETLEDRGAHTGLMIGALNGDAYRAQDWGYALVQFRRLQGLPEWYPAASFGELGAASGPVGLCMAIRGFARGYCKTDNVLVWTLGDDGSRGSFYLRSPKTLTSR